VQKLGELILTISTSYEMFVHNGVPFDDNDDCSCVKILVTLIFYHH